MPTQNYANHRRYPVRRYYLPVVASAVFCLALVLLVRPELLPTRVYSAMPVLIGGALLLGWFNGRVMVNKVQDRAIRAEENFRHFLLTGKPLPDGLKKGQIVALRFASDAEFPALAQRALAETLKGEAIKQAIQAWRPDTYRA